jgi:hypothetical protein
MKSRVLYFPYIRVPESSWLTQMLLYWDQVSSIVPYDFIAKPELLGDHMLNLVRENLVFQVIPSAYIYEIPRFFDGFMTYVESLGQEIDDRRDRFARGNAFRIHIEKLDNLGDALVRQRLAALDRYPWYDVECDTANDFMSYLAASLGQVNSIDSSPVTDNGGYLRRLALAGVSQDAVASQLDALRIQVLDHILPVPSHPVQASEIRIFKEQHRNELGDFRRCVERELVEAASIPEPVLRDRHLELFFDEASARMEEIQEAMRGAGWKTARTGLSVIAAIPGVKILGLVGALWDVLAGKGSRNISRDFAYAAHARGAFGHRTGDVSHGS